jgi:hypothetical protein
MKTKAMLLAAAAVAFVASSQAQVYSVNAVGYVNTTLKPGFNLVSNPLLAADNSIGNVFKNIQGTIPGGLSVFKFVNNNFVSASWDEFDLKFAPDEAAAVTVVPGEGVFVFNPGTTDLKVTFVGEVVQGNTTTPIPKGFSIKSSVVPQAGKPDAFGLPGAPGDSLYKYDTTIKNYVSSTFDEFDAKWVPDLPVINVGEAFFYFRAGNATNWTRTFSVNNPT